MKLLIIQMLTAAIIATIIGAAFWLMEWNALFGWVYVWTLIGITLNLGRRLDR